MHNSKYDNYLLRFHLKFLTSSLAAAGCLFYFMFILHFLLIYSDLWHSWSPEEQMEYEECDKNSMFGKLGCVAEPLS